MPSHALPIPARSRYLIRYRANTGWNTRAILMDPSEAQGIIGKIGKKWKFQQRGLKDQVFKSTGGGQLNHFAMSMVADTDGALAEATSGDVHFCYLSSSIVLQLRDKEVPG